MQTAPNAKQQTVVVGLGKTGLSCVRYLLARGHHVTVVDSRPEPPLLAELGAIAPGVSAHTGGFDPRLFARADLLVVSPGVSLREPAIAQALARGVPAVGDVELFAREIRRPVIAITGANGKSTVTSLVGEMCKAAGFRTAVAGNIGTPVLSLLEQPPYDVYVLELSSFQLETTTSLNAVAATVLNIVPDHMDRYRDLDEYTAAKERVFRGTGMIVLNREDPKVMAMASAGRRALRFGLLAPETNADFGVIAHEGQECLAHGEELLMPARDVPLPGGHNLANTLAAMALASCVDVPVHAMRRAVAAFKGLAHRTEWVAEADGVRWIDDSKGTNVGATVAALSGMREPVVLIAGGDGKGADFSPLKAAVAARARAVILIGRDAALIESAIAGAVPIVHASDMADAVRRAREHARHGDSVLLSPACASFDMFRNFEHRGEVFKQAVRELLAQKEVRA